MRKGISIFLVVTMCFFVFGQFGVLAKNDKVVEKNMHKHTLHMKGNKFKSLKDVKIPFGLEKKGYKNNEKGYYIVSFAGPITESWKAEVKNTGAILHNYVPDFAFLVEMDNKTKAQIESLPFVTETVIYQPFFKLQPELVDEYGVKKLKDGKADGEFFIQTFDNDLSSVETIVKNARGKFKVKNRKTSRLQINREYLTQLAQLDNVKYIQEVKPYKLHNDIARGFTDVDDLQLLGYDGTGQIVGVADTGIDTGVNDSSMHLDFQGRIASIYGLGRPGNASDTHGHGTHVAGSILGDGARSNGLYKGMAPGAHLVFQSTLDSIGSLSGIPSNLSDMFEQAYDDGARIHNNSWGASYYEYTVSSMQVDQFVNKHRDMVILISAGNDGDEVPGQCVGSPATAKNGITVGASETYRPEMGETRFGNIGDDPNSIVIFSGRGWTEDGRVKPDVVAPGTWILSTKSSLAADDDFWGTFDEYYAYMGGTSMSCPVTAGAVAVARQYVEENWNINPTASLMKAVMINGATDLGMGIPEQNQGWGRISLTNSLTEHDVKWVNETCDLLTGDRMVHNYSVESSNTPLKMTLVWTDVPASPMVTKSLVNDLDLKVTAPDGTVYYGNDFTSPFDSTFDRANNVENVFVNNPVIGNWTVEVLGYNVPFGPQNYSLVIGADLDTTITDINAPTVNITAPNDGVTVSNVVNLSADASDDNGVNRVEFYVGGTYVGRDYNSPYSISWDSATVGNGSYSLTAKAFDAANNETTSAAVTITTDNLVAPMIRTETFTGYLVDVGTDLLEHTFEVTGTGTVEATLSWDTGADLDMYFYDDSGYQFRTSSDTKKPESISWEAYTTGTYKIRVLYLYHWGFDTEANYTLTITYPVSGGTADSIAPSCSLTSPSNGSTVSGTTTISASASDNVGVDRVEFYANGNLIGTDATSPYSINWDTTTVSNGSYTLEANAYDAVNNVGTSNITVTVNNVVDTTAPSCSITAPADGATVSGTTTISANASDDIAVDKVEFYVDGALIGTDITSPYSVDWNSATVSNGSSTLEAKAYDTSGNIGTSTSIAVTVDNAVVTKQFTGNVDKSGTVEQYFDIDLIATGDIDLSLTWDSSADLDMYLYDSSGTEVKRAYSTSKPETISYAATTIGQYQIKVKAYSGSGNFTLTATYPGINIVDTTAPTCSITAPTNGATVSGTTTISATASDDISVDKVEFYVDSTLVATDTTSPYSLDWNTASVSNGNYALEVKAYDAAGNVGTSTIINVTVDNIIDTTAPTCSIIAPTDGTTVSGTTTISATASDDVAVDQVEFYVDGSLIGTDTTSPYSFDWNTTTVANGSYSLEAKAYDAAGNVGTSTVINVVAVDNGSGTGSEVYTGTVSTTGSDGHEFFIDVTGPCTIDLHLDWIGTGDLDLYLYTPGGSWADTSFYSKPETISYSATTTGQYRILVDAYSGSGDYTLTVTY